MTEKYKSPYEAYPFLRDDSRDLRCDFEIFTDELSSRTGLLRANILKSNIKEEEKLALGQDLKTIAELIYHANPTLRTKFLISDEEIEDLKNKIDTLGEEVKDSLKGFLLPIGGQLGCESHLLRVKAKALVRLVYRHIELSESVVPNGLLDFLNLLSGYFFYLAIKLNSLEGVEEIPFTSRIYN